ncbi:hypothetical protein C0991_007107 [Blastosporella zonata]|nr:hypothetical protein C0991_007107 [Blastosporella zonata]
MNPCNFKLTELDGLTRRVTFPGKPTWYALAAKIELLFGIPIEKVSVSYTDADNDQVTLSSQEELEDLYATSHSSGQVIKFTVQDLTTARLQRTLSRHSRNPSRNTFGIGAIDIEDDWQTLPIPPISELQGLFIPDSFNEGYQHAFVEVLESDAGTAKKEGKRETSAPSVGSSPDSPFVVPLDKGKQKAAPDDDVSSTGSVLGEDAPPKPPVHVYDFQVPITSEVPASSVSLHITAESTPKVKPQNLGNIGADAMDAPKESVTDDDPTDPPLHALDTPTPHVSPSFSNDITSLLTSFTNVVAAHPELSEGIRNILRNTSNGSYWQAHRDYVSQAAQNISRDAGRATEALRRETEEEAVRRVADALGGIFRTVSQTLHSVQTVAPAATDTTSPAETQPTNDDAAETAPAMNTQDTDNVLPDPPRPAIPNFSPHFDHRPEWPYGPRPIWTQPPTHFAPPRWPYRPRPGPTIPIPEPPPPMPNWYGWVPPPPPPVTIHYPPGPPTPPSAPFPESPLPPQAQKMSPQELRAQVDEAKARYKAEKEKYRQEREERRKEREMKAQTVAGELNAPKTKYLDRSSTPHAIAVHGKYGEPTHEVMGFSESTHPELPGKIKAQLPADGVVRSDSEDDIVTTLLEDLLAVSPKPPAASGSGARQVPGAWH